MKKMYEYINYIEVDKKTDELERISRIESGMHSPSVKNLLQILGPLGYTIKIEKVKSKKNSWN